MNESEIAILEKIEMCSALASIDLFPYQKNPNFNIGVAFSKGDMYAWKSME